MSTLDGMVLGLLPLPALTGQSMLLVLAAVLVAVVVSMAYGAGPARSVPSFVLVTARRHEHRRSAYVRLSDPSAAGRPRPRAPSCRSTSA
jgi:hypothetical protein